MATNVVVPAPPKGSSTIQFADPLFSQVQVGCHLFVAFVVGIHPVLSVLVGELPGTWAGSRLLICPVFSITLSHGLPHTSHAFGLVPAKIQGSIKSGGNVAK